MKYRFKQYLGLLLVVVVGLSLTACGSNKPDTIKVSCKDVSTQLVAAQSKLDNATAAQGFLNAYLERNPDSMYARKLLAQALLKTGQPAEARKLADAAAKAKPDYAQSMSIFGDAK